MVTLVKGVVLGLLTKAAIDLLERQVGPDWPDRAVGAVGGLAREATTTGRNVLGRLRG